MSFLQELTQLHQNNLREASELSQSLVEGVNSLVDALDIHDETLVEAAENVAGTIYAMVKNDKDPIAALGSSKAQTALNDYHDQLGKFMAALQATIEVGLKQTDDKQSVLAATLDDANFKPEDSAFKKLLVVGDKFKAGKAYFQWSQKFDDYTRALETKSNDLNQIKANLGKEIQQVINQFRQVNGKLNRGSETPSSATPKLA